MSQRSLKAKLMLFFILFAFIPAAIGGVISIYMNVTSTRSSAVQSNKNTAVQVAKQIEIMLDDSKGMVEGLASGPNARALDGASLHDGIVAMQQKNPQFELIFVMNSSGMQIARSSGNLANRGERAYFKEAMKGETFFTDSYISASTNAPCVTVSAPIKDGNGTIIGVVGADISLQALQGIADNVKIGEKGYVEIVDNVGNVIAHPNHDKVLQKESFAQLDYVQQVINGQAGCVEALSTRGDKTITAFAPVANHKWGIIVNQPMAEIFDVAISAAYLIIAILIISILLATVTAYYIARGIADPLQKVVESVEMIANGNLSQTLVAEGVVEVNKLVTGVNHMAVSLRKIIKQTASAAESLAASAEEMMASAEQSAQASNQVASSTTEVAGRVNGQLGLVDSTVEVVDRISKEIQQFATNTMTVSASVKKTELAANEGEHSIGKAINQMNVIEEKTNQTASIIGELEQKSRQIGKIVDEIAAIAGKTNILTRNAANEIGEIGKNGGNFVTVADEVGKLAAQSQQFTQEITTLITEMQDKTSTAVLFMNEGKKEVSTGSQVVNVAGKRFQEIAQMVKEITQQINELSVATQQIARESENVLNAVLGIDEESKKIAEQTETVSAATEEQSASMEEIAMASQSLAKMAEELQTTVEIFKI